MYVPVDVVWRNITQTRSTQREQKSGKMNRHLCYGLCGMEFENKMYCSRIPALNVVII